MRSVRLTELVDKDTLQRLQDSFAAATRSHLVTRDVSGQAVTQPSHPTKLCELLDCEALHELCGAPLDVGAAKAWEPSPEQPMGVVRFVEPIGLDGACLGSIEMTGVLARGKPAAACFAEVSKQLGLGPQELSHLVDENAVRDPAAIDAARDLLRSMAGVLSDLCRSAYELNEKVHELSVLRDLSNLLTGTTDLQERLDILTRITTETLGVKGCLIRLLDEANKELVIKSVYNLSQRYLEKGPVNLPESPIDQEAMEGGVVYVADATRDPRVQYPREAAEEGICSGLCVALRSKGRAIGTIRVYTSHPHEFSADEVRLFEAIANQAAALIENAALYTEALRAEALDDELATAARIQRHLLPDADPVIPGFDIASRYIPFEAVGGDLFDFVPIQNEHLGIVIADVAGKGVPAAILMAATRSAFRGHIETVYAARDIVSMANHTLCRDIGEDQFVTLFYGALDTVSRRFTYCNAGHAAPILFRDGQHCELTEGGLVLGIDPKTPYEERQFRLASGDVVVFYTDGLTETVNPEREMFGRNRVVGSVLPHLAGSAETILDGVWHAVRDFARGVPARDDFTIIVLKVV